MRLTSVQNLIGGEIIARDILTSEGGILLRASTKFRPAFKDKLLARNITHVFITDHISKGITPPELISSELKIKLSQNLRSQFESVQKVMHINMEEIHSTTTTIIENMQDKNIILDMLDLQRNDSYTYSHCLNVAILSCALGKKLGFNAAMLEKTVKGAILHDIGKMIIPKDILNKPGKLTMPEKEVMDSHCKLGYDLIKDNPAMSPITKIIVLCHHEREDSSGYPLGKGDELHIAAKLVAVADVFDALIADRPYRQGFPINTALSILKQERLNTEIIHTLENIIAFYPVGSTVLLNNYHVGLVEQNFADDLRRPLVRVFYNLNTRTAEDYKCNLKKETDKYIIEKLNSISMH